MHSAEIAFVDRDVPEIFASRVVRVDVLTGGIVRFYMATEEDGPEGKVYLLTLKILVPMVGVMAHQHLIASAIGGNPPGPAVGALAMH